jgi:hypothetical protein
MSLFVLNFIAWGALEATPRMRLVMAILNILFLQAFCKLVRNQRAVVKAIKSTEKVLSERLDHPPHRILLPNFEEEYCWFTNFKSADLLSKGIVIFTVTYFVYIIWKYFLA